MCGSAHGLAYLCSSGSSRVFDKLPYPVSESLEVGRLFTPGFHITGCGEIIIKGGEGLPVVLKLAIVSPATGLNIKFRETPVVQLLN